jgi:L-threonylcarbamoyladenylate synthase
MKAQILSATPESIEMAARLLQEGQVVGMPTETVYGLAGNAFDETALTRIFSVKERPTFDPLIVHVARPARSKKLLEYLFELGLLDLTSLSSSARVRIERLLEAFWPGPFTVVLPKLKKVPDLVTSGLDAVAIRMPRHPVSQSLIKAAGTPLAAPSANRFGRISPTAAQDVFEELGDRIPLILDGGKSEIGLESTILSIQASGALSLLRPGAVSISQIETIAGARLSSAVTSTGPAQLASPGMLDSHYAPRKSLLLLPAPISKLSEEQKRTILSLPTLPVGPLGLLVQSGFAKAAEEVFSKITQHEVIAQSLSKTGRLEERARKLFSALRALDNSDAVMIFAEPCSTKEGLGHAIGDRLRRASSGSLSK